MPRAARHVEKHLADRVLVEIAYDGRRHMLDLAATYQRAADQIAPPPHPETKSAPGEK